MSTANLQNAIWLGSQRLHIFPLYPVRVDTGKTACACNDGENCKRIGKHPIHDDFAERATCDEGAIRLLWEPCPDAEIALLTGQKSGIVALEIRPSKDNPNPLQGYAVPPAPAIVCAGNTVRLYSAPDEPIKKRVKLKSGLALRGEKSFVVLPDAIAANGEKYDWAPSQTLKVPISPLPSYFENPAYFAAEADEFDHESSGPTREDLDARNVDPYYHDEPTRESFNRDEPPNATNAAPKTREKRAYSLGEIFESEDPPDNSICGGLGIWHGDRPMALVGAWGTAKTWIMIWLALQLATARPLFDNPQWPVKRPLRVIIFDYELNLRVYKKRLRELCTTMGIDYRAIRDSIYYYERPKFYLTDPNAYQRFLEESKGFDVILIDALRGAAPGVDENKSEFRDNIDKLAELASQANQFVCLLHHAGKGEDSKFRGTSGIGDAVGVMFTVTNDKVDPRGPKKLHNEKMGSNADDYVDDFFVLLKRDECESGNGPMRITFMAAEQAKEKAENIEKEEWIDTKKKILRKVQAVPGISKNELQKAVGGNSGTFDKVLAHLEKKLQYIENKGNGTRHKYEITSTGVEWLNNDPRYAARTYGPNASTTPNAPPPFDTTDDTPEPAKGDA